MMISLECHRAAPLQSVFFPFGWSPITFDALVQKCSSAREACVVNVAATGTADERDGCEIPGEQSRPILNASQDNSDLFVQGEHKLRKVYRCRWLTLSSGING